MVDNADAEAGGAYCKYFYMTMPHRRKCGISRPPAYAPTEPGRPDFLKGFTSWLHADRYFVYHRLSHTIQEISRWTHLCRKSGKAVRDLQKSQQSGYSALKGLQYLLELKVKSVVSVRGTV